MVKGNIRDKLAAFDDLWHPKVIAELNGQQVKLAKVEGEFVWHKHEAEDEFFLVLHGDLVIEFHDREVRLGEGDFIVVPRGVEHRPVAEAEVHLMLVEPASTVNTGNVVDERTVGRPDRI